MQRSLTAACALSILILGILTLTFSTHAKRNFQPMQSPTPVNVALATNGAVASASSTHFSGNFPVAAVNNGDRKGTNWGSGGGWNDNTHGDTSSDIVQINFPAFNFVSQINVFTLRDTYQDNQTPPTVTETFSTCENSGFGITEFEVQLWNGSMWVTVPSGLVRDNNKIWRQFTFPEVWASGVRVQVHGAARTIAKNYSRIVEIEAYGPTAGFNFAAATNGAVASASSTFDSNYPVSAVNDGDRTGFNWGRGGFGSGWRDATENEFSIDWVRIDFSDGQARRINEIDVYTLRDGFSTKTDDPTIFEIFPTADDSGGYGITDYDVQYLSGGVWRNVPGGKVTNNNKARRQFRFSPITTNAIRVAVHKGVNYTTTTLNWSRIVEIEAWENAAVSDDVVWVEDALPAGAISSGASEEPWNWTCSNPLPLSGTLAHTSAIIAGAHQHYFFNATQTLIVNAGDTLVAHVYLDPANPPTQVMLGWNDGTWDHAAYWGASQLPWGVEGTVSRRNMGPLPPTGQWVRLEVPASLVGLEGRTLNGMGFSLFNGRATWDHAGKYAGAVVQPTISISDISVNEGNSGIISAWFAVTLSSASTQTISVNVATADGTASSSSDYLAASGTVNFAPGQTSQLIPIQVVGDTVLESNENFFVNLSNPVNATIADNQGVGTILNDDTLPTISISDYAVDERSSGTTPTTFTVTLSSASTQQISVNYATANGTAGSPSDYVGAGGTVTFAPGQTSQPITIQVVGDKADESDENFFVNLSNPVNATLADSQGACTIRNLSYFEIPVYFHIIRDSNGTGDVAESRLDEQIEVLNGAFDGTTKANVQFYFRKVDVKRYSKDAWFNMQADTIDDMKDNEFPEEYEAKRTLHQGGANVLNFYTALGNPGSPYRVAWATFAEDYADNPCRDGVVVPYVTLPGDSTPNNPFNKGDIPVHEVGHWLGLLHTFEAPPNTSCDLVNDQVDDTPTHKNDFIGQCPPPSTDTCPDPGTDPIHNYMTNYSDYCKSEFTPGQYRRMRAQYLAHRKFNTMTQQCPIITISIKDLEVEEGNSERKTAGFKLTLSSPNNSVHKVKVKYASVAGTASPANDYSGFSTGLQALFESGQTEVLQSILIDGDTEVEANETFFINLSEPRNAMLADDTQGVVTILNDDPPPISISDVSVTEGNSGNTTAVFTVTLSNPSTKPIDVNYATANGTASSPGDYLGASGSVHFAPQQTSGQISIKVVGDTVFEPNENFFVNLSNPVNATLADNQGVGTILNDDAPVPAYEGYIDIADCNSIIGWAADRNRLNTGIYVSIYDGTNFVTNVPANDLRSDVGAYLGDNGKHGFAILTPPQFKDGLPHTLRVKFESSTIELSGSGGTIACAAPTTYYEIVARHSGKCLDVEGESMAAGARVIQFVCGGWTNQQWQIIPVGDGYVRVVARHSGKVLDVQGGGLDNGNPVWQFDENGTAGQQWQIIDVGGGYVRIVARHSGKVLDVAGVSFDDLAQIHQWDYVGGANQQWLLRPVP